MVFGFSKWSSSSSTSNFGTSSTCDSSYTEDFNNNTSKMRSFLPAHYRFRAHSWFADDREDEFADIDPAFFSTNRAAYGRSSFGHNLHHYHQTHNAFNNLRIPRR
jgi:hypothetical protein